MANDLTTLTEGRFLKDLKFADQASGAEVYAEKGGEPVRVRVGDPQGLAALGMDGTLPADKLPANHQDLPSRMTAVEAGQGSGTIGYATKALMDADLAHAEGTVAKVTNDGTTANNGEYRKTGASGAGSWTKSAYDPKNEVVQMGDLVRNRGAAFPLRSMTRSGTTSAAMTQFNNAILKVRVIGARVGKYYRLSYFKNGAALAGPQDGWIITEYPVETYATAAAETQVLHYTHAAPDIPRSGLVETVRLASPVVAGLEFVISVDTSQLPALGSSIDANSSNARPAWSWIIDPSCYEYPTSILSGGAHAASGIHVSGDAATRTYAVVLPMGRTHMARVTFKPNGKNGLFNIRKVEVSTSGNPLTASWTTMSDTDTDWFPPLIVRAVANGDGSTSHYYTGGNHGSDGSSGGTTTASLDFLAVDIDGRTLSASEVVAGYARSITFRWSNSVMGYNTITAARSIIRQWFTAQVTSHGIEVMCRTEALEAVVVETDNGPQVMGTGFADSCHFYDGEAQARQLAANVNTSGQKSVAPNAFAFSLGSANGFLSSWMDRAFGVGDGSFVAPSWAYMRKNASIWKFYHAAVAGMDAPLAAGQGYSWRGGYGFSPATIVSGTGIDSAFVYSKGGKPWLAWAFTGPGTGLVALPAMYAGRAVGAGVVEPLGLVSNAGGYSIRNTLID